MNFLKLVNSPLLLYGLTITTFIAFLFLFQKNQTNFVIFYALTLILIQCYTKNMIIILATGLLVIMLVKFKKSLKRLTKENFENKLETKKELATESKTPPMFIQQTVKQPETVENYVPVSDEMLAKVPEQTQSKEALMLPELKIQGEENPFGVSKINYAATLDEAYGNLNNLIGDQGIDQLTSQSKQLLQQQNKLVETMKGLQPLMANAKELINSFKSMSFVNA